MERPIRQSKTGISDSKISQRLYYENVQGESLRGGIIHMVSQNCFSAEPFSSWNQRSAEFALGNAALMRQLK